MKKKNKANELYKNGTGGFALKTQIKNKYFRLLCLKHALAMKPKKNSNKIITRHLKTLSITRVKRSYQYRLNLNPLQGLFY